MDSDLQRKALVAVDLGAQSCRVSLLRWDQSKPVMKVMHRFENAPVQTTGGLRWDLERILGGVLAGLRACAAAAPEGIASIGVDGWAVDYARLEDDNRLAGLPFCYRDPRTEAAESEVHKRLPPDRLYRLTGIQLLRINTVYQLYADQLAGLNSRARWVNLPEFITYRLCGRRVSEYTNATHTGLVRLGTQGWCEEIFRELQLDMAAAPPIVPCGSILDEVSGELAQLPAYRGTKLIAPACHDTAAAIAAIPAVGDDWAFISSGTWSLVGTVLEAPLSGEDARAMNFTNLGGAGGRICFLKNVNGMWLLRQCMEQWEQRGIHWTLDELISRSGAMEPPGFRIDVDDPPLLLPGNVLGAIHTQLESQGLPGLEPTAAAAPAVANLIFHSMAARYAEVLSLIGRITGKELRRLFIVGGGNQNALLNRLTAERSGLSVILGARESATVGNFSIQLAALDNAASTAGVTAAAVAAWAERLSEIAVS